MGKEALLCVLHDRGSWFLWIFTRVCSGIWLLAQCSSALLWQLSGHKETPLKISCSMSSQEKVTLSSSRIWGFSIAQVNKESKHLGRLCWKLLSTGEQNFLTQKASLSNDAELLSCFFSGINFSCQKYPQICEFARYLQWLHVVAEENCEILNNSLFFNETFSLTTRWTQHWNC